MLNEPMILSEETIAAIVAAHSPLVPAPGSVQEPLVVIEDNSVEDLPDEVEELGITTTTTRGLLKLR